SALRESRVDVGSPPSSNMYVAWSIRPDVVARPGRRPTSVMPFIRNFGTWPRALVAAGLIASEDDAVISNSGSVRRAAFRITEEKLLGDIRFMVERLGHVPRCGEYDHERDKLIDEVIRRGGGGRVPASYSTIQTRFRTWNAALEKAGFAPFHAPTGRTYG